MTASAEPSAAASVGLTMHRTGFVFNAALTGTLAGTLLALALGSVLYLHHLVTDAGANLVLRLGLLLSGLLLGALLGTALGLVAGVRALRGPVRSLPPLRAGLLGGTLLGLLGLVAGALAGLLLAPAFSGYGDTSNLTLYAGIVLAILCAPLGLITVGHVGYGCPPGLLAAALAFVGGLLGAVPGVLTFTLIDVTASGVARLGLICGGLTAGGLAGGVLVGLLVEMGLRRPSGDVPPGSANRG